MQKKLKIQSRKVEFEGFNGSLLEGSLDFPLEIPPRQYIIISHCFTCSKQILTTARLSRGLAHAGMAVLSFDFTGLGYSEGVFADTHFSSMVKDITCAADWLATHYAPASILIGHSMGGDGQFVCFTKCPFITVTCAKNHYLSLSFLSCTCVASFRFSNAEVT